MTDDDGSLTAADFAALPLVLRSAQLIRALFPDEDHTTDESDPAMAAHLRDPQAIPALASALVEMASAARGLGVLGKMLRHIRQVELATEYFLMIQDIETTQVPRPDEQRD